MNEKTEGIVICTTEYKDNRHIVRILTGTHGLLDFCVRTGRHTIVRTGHIQPLTRVLISADIRPSRSIHTLRECTPLDSSASVAAHPVKAPVAMLLSEILRNVLHAAEADSSTYSYISGSIDTYAALTRGIANFHLIFLIGLALCLGFFPNLSGFHDGVFFDLRESAFTSSQPLHTDYLSQDESIIFANLLRADYSTMHLFSLSRSQRNSILDRIMRYYSLHLPGFTEPKSLAILRTLWD